MTGRPSVAEPPVREIELSRVFDAPRKLVFKAWTDPQQFAQWWGPKQFTNPRCELDARPGGAILIHMRGPDGAILPVTGAFLEVVEAERLVFTTSMYGTELRNSVTFDDDKGKTRLTMTVSLVKSPSDAGTALEGAKWGLSQSLERLADHVAAATSAPSGTGKTVT
jgi:uncharacterized protein YndB with AHSA1/START domain